MPAPAVYLVTANEGDARAVRSPSKQPLLIVGNEISGTTAVFQIDLH